MLAGQKGYAQCPGSVYAGDDTTICFSTNRVLLGGIIVRPNGNAMTGYWSGGTGTFIPDSAALNGVYIPSQAEVDAGQLTLILLPHQNCAPNKSDTVVISIQKVLESTVTGPDAICEYSSGNNYSVTSVSGISYEWHVVGGYITSGSSSNAISVYWGSAGPGYIYVIQTDALGCVGVSSIDPISRFHFNTPDLLHAEIGSDATSADADAYGNGTGFVMDANCGATKGLDLVIPGSNFDRGKMCMTFSWQRDESEAHFFTRGGTEFYISGGSVRVKLTQISGTGSQVIGPVNTGYSIPNDDVLRYFTFCYDSASGIARVLVNDSIVWNYTTPAATSLYWTGAGNATIGGIMDGNCSGNTLIDWANVSIPISIFRKPQASLYGMDTVCRYDQEAYYCDTPSTVSFAWSSTGATILSGQTGPYATVSWPVAGTQDLYLLLTDSNTGCDSSYIYSVKVDALPDVIILGDDSLCINDTNTYSLSSTAQLYSWSRNLDADVSAGNTFTSVWDSSGQFDVYLEVTDTLTGCLNADTLPVWVQTYPEPILTGPSSWCIDEAASVNVTNSSGMTYSWTASSGNILSGQSTEEISVRYSSAGNYTIYIQVTDPDFGCSVQESLNVLVNSKPVTGSIYHD
ncbi:MAG TPA: hypothetical protein DIW47_00290 [Bacteroidetes bacterium]|nr:hypothetical protein [Bacteroidota bacterium]